MGCRGQRYSHRPLPSGPVLNALGLLGPKAQRKIKTRDVQPFFRKKKKKKTQKNKKTGSQNVIVSLIMP